MLATARLILFSNTHTHTHTDTHTCTQCEQSRAELSTYQMSPVISTHLYLPRGSAPAEPVCAEDAQHKRQHAFYHSAVEYATDTIIMLQCTVVTYLHNMPINYAGTLATLLHGKHVRKYVRGVCRCLFTMSLERDVIHSMSLTTPTDELYRISLWVT